MQAIGSRITWFGTIAFLAGQIAYGQGMRSVPEFSNRTARNAGYSTPAMQYFGGGRFRPTSSNHVRRLLPAPQPVQLRGVKPFQGIQRAQGLSPYLGLDFSESASGIPNYYAYVRPQQQLRLANRAQATRNQQLQQQLRRTTAQGIISENPSGGVPTTGHSSQFMNMGGYFPGAR